MSLRLILEDEAGRIRVVAVDVTTESVKGHAGDLLLDDLHFCIGELDASAKHVWTTEEILEGAG